MCRVEERVYIGTDGHRTKFEEQFLCDEAGDGDLCSQVARRITEYRPRGILRALRDDSPSLILAPQPNPLGRNATVVEYTKDLDTTAFQPMSANERVSGMRKMHLDFKATSKSSKHRRKNRRKNSLKQDPLLEAPHEPKQEQGASTYQKSSTKVRGKELPESHVRETVDLRTVIEDFKACDKFEKETIDELLRQEQRSAPESSERRRSIGPWPTYESNGPYDSTTHIHDMITHQHDDPLDLPTTFTEEMYWKQANRSYFNQDSDNEEMYWKQANSSYFNQDSDNESITSSYANSVLSVASLASSATGFSIHSKYSAVQIAEDTSELIVILPNDDIVALLCMRAVTDACIGLGKLERNLLRLFKAYAELLGREAGDTLEFLASRLVRAKARNVAQHIIVKYSTSSDTSRRFEQIETQEESSDDAESVPVDESVFEDLALFHEFLSGSQSFTTLRAQIEPFIVSKFIRQEAVKPAEMCLDSGNVDTIDEGEHAVPVTLKREHEGTYIGILRGIKRTTSAVMIAAGYLEPSLDPDFTRLRWQCKCGDTFFGDVIEYRAGGVARLIERMQSSTGNKIIATSYSDSTSNQKYTLRSPNWMRGAIQTFLTVFGQRGRPSSCLPLTRTPSTASTNVSTNTPPPQQETLHLMACMQRGRYRRTVRQDHIENIATDRALFCFMRSQLATYRGRIRKYLPLKCVQGLFFVKFRLRACGSAEVRDHEPCCTSSVPQTCDCIPPAPKVEPAPDAEYRCDPAGPLDWWPPVLSQELMHMLSSPECINEGENFVLRQLPKRIKGELLGKAGQPAEGWGIHDQEGWDFDLLIGIVLAVFLVGSLLFAVLWSHFKLDVQGAFGVSSYMVTASGIFIAWIVNRADKLG